MKCSKIVSLTGAKVHNMSKVHYHMYLHIGVIVYQFHLWSSVRCLNMSCALYVGPGRLCVFYHRDYYYQNITISDFIIIWRSTAYLQFKVHLLHFCNLLHVCYLNFGTLFFLKLSASSLQNVTKCLFSRKLCK